MLYANNFHNQTNSTLMTSEIDEKRTLHNSTYRITIATHTHPVGCTYGCVACSLYSLYLENVFTYLRLVLSSVVAFDAKPGLSS
jgi:hypothetical protein